ncbi:MAG TPA: hypothetical protein VGK10_09125 [Prolixibacteraceae bacterium]|jgi:hypothetical protein
MKTKILALLVILTFAFYACEKQDGVGPTTDLTDLQLKSASIAVNDVAVEGVTQEANYETDFYAGYENLLRQLAHFKGGKGNLMEGHKGMHYVEGQTPVVSIDTAAAGYPIVITIEYGDSTATKNGRVISGTVKIELSGKKGTDGSTRTISYIGCKIDSIGIEGTSSQTFNRDTTTTRTMTLTSDITFTLADGTVLHRTGDSVREWIKGLDTPLDREDDMIQTTGSLHVVSSTGDTYVKLITEPLIEIEDCHHPVSGIVQYIQNDVLISELNYGDGTCDNLAELTTGGETIEIELHGKMPKADLKGHHPDHMDGKGNKGGMGDH